MDKYKILILLSLLVSVIFISSCVKDFNGENNTSIGNCARNLSNCFGGSKNAQNIPPSNTNNNVPTNNVNTSPNQIWNSNTTQNITASCPKDVKNCWGAGNVLRVPPTCEFESCAKFGIPPNTCNYDSDCKVIMSICSCEGVPTIDPRDWINGSYCKTNECMLKETLIAKAVCENNVCKKYIKNVSICEDSDSGKDYNVTGVARIRFDEINFVPYIGPDICLNSMVLNESYCEGPSVGWLNNTLYTCPFGCLNGQCKSNSTG